jgi:hypothetical protein
MDNHIFMVRRDRLLTSSATSPEERGIDAGGDSVSLNFVAAALAASLPKTMI